MWIANRTFSNFRGSFPMVQWCAIIWFLIFNCRLLIRVLLLLYSRSSFHDIACFSILASGPHFETPITSENILRISSIDNVVGHLYGASLVLEDFSSRSTIPLIIKYLNPFIALFFRMVHYEKLFRWPSLKYRAFSEDPTWSDLFPSCS